MADWDFSKLLHDILLGHVPLGPYVPPRGMAEHLIGSGPNPWKSREILAVADPQPSPWHSIEIQAAASLLSAISLKVAASRMMESPQKASLERSMDVRITELIDDYCGTPPGSPWPGPPSFAYGLAAGLSFLAGTLGQGALQVAVEEVSTRVLKKITLTLNPQPLPP
jgi:hypothetical protein